MQAVFPETRKNSQITEASNSHKLLEVQTPLAHLGIRPLLHPMIKIPNVTQGTITRSTRSLRKPLAVRDFSE